MSRDSVIFSVADLYLSSDPCHFSMHLFMIRILVLMWDDVGILRKLDLKRRIGIHMMKE